MIHETYKNNTKTFPLALNKRLCISQMLKLGLPLY